MPILWKNRKEEKFKKAVLLGGDDNYNYCLKTPLEDETVNLDDDYKCVEVSKTLYYRDCHIPIKYERTNTPQNLALFHVELTGLTGSSSRKIVLDENPAPNKVRILQKLYDRELETYQSYIVGVEIDIDSIISDLIEVISEISYSKASLELTPKPSVIFNLTLGSSRKLYIERLFNPSENGKEVFFSLFQDDKCLYNGMGNLGEVFADINSILKD